MRTLATALLLVSLGAQAADSHRSRAERAESLGRTAAAAREYEAAYEEERDAALLYRLALARKHLKQYRKAKDALRGYLRAAPEGALAAEAERQLAQIAILIEASVEDPPDPGPALKPSRRPAPRKRDGPAQPQQPDRAPSRDADTRQLHAGDGGQAEAKAASSGISDAASTAGAVWTGVAVATDGAPSTAGAVSTGAAVATDGAPSTGGAALQDEAAPRGPADGEVRKSSARSAPSGTEAGVTNAGAPARVAASATVPAQALADGAAAPARPTAAAARWLGASAVLAGAAGGILWWQGAHTARDLDARFATGDLTAADSPRYGRARGEGIAGRALVGLAAALAAGAVAFWW